VREYLDEGRVRRVLFALSDDAEARERNWTDAAREVSGHLREGKTCAFATIGDPNVYSTFTYLARTVRATLPDVAVETVPGITAMQDLASRSGTVLLEGDERLALLPFTAGEERLREALASFETVVCYKGGNRMPEVLSRRRGGEAGGRGLRGPARDPRRRSRPGGRDGRAGGDVPVDGHLYRKGGTSWVRSGL
jgi:precorrin-2/cobalt-factor-2 C20-methyltransferase